VKVGISAANSAPDIGGPGSERLSTVNTVMNRDHNTDLKITHLHDIMPVVVVAISEIVSRIFKKSK
jgi:hypothetical protein